MTSVVDLFRSILPLKAKSSPSGWTSFNAPCCHHRGHSHDTRKRGGVLFSDGGIIYNCFNCKFSTGWKPGTSISLKFKTLCEWLNVSDDIIKEMVFEALKSESVNYVPQEVKAILFDEKPLPEAAMPIKEWLDSEYFPDIENELVPVIDYLTDRGFDPLGDFYWSPMAGYENRVIIPFRYNGKIVGNTARKVTDGRPKYISDQAPNFVFNLDQQLDDSKYCFVVEGPFDAISIGGVAILTNEISDQHARLINNIGKKVIVIPDQDTAGLNVIKRAGELGWSVAFPTWDQDIKDCSDAVNRYGKLFVIVDAIKTAESNPIKIEMSKRQMIQRLKLGE